MADTTPAQPITIESPFGTLVTNSVKLAQFAAALADIATRAGDDTTAAPLPFEIGGMRFICHANGGGDPIR